MYTETVRAENTALIICSPPAPVEQTNNLLDLKQLLHNISNKHSNRSQFQVTSHSFTRAAIHLFATQKVR